MADPLQLLCPSPISPVPARSELAAVSAHLTTRLAAIHGLLRKTKSTAQHIEESKQQPGSMLDLMRRASIEIADMLQNAAEVCTLHMMQQMLLGMFQAQGEIGTQDRFADAGARNQRVPAERPPMHFLNKPRSATTLVKVCQADAFAETVNNSQVCFHMPVATSAKEFGAPMPPEEMPAPPPEMEPWSKVVVGDSGAGVETKPQRCLVGNGMSKRARCMLATTGDFGCRARLTRERIAWLPHHRTLR